ncbi:peptidoglycan-binding protein [Oricola thermophila]|uniref:SEL1-like repeat protein n=1 Tax=Oricola thermophila TaxID=2742145 RepID=A0A6N1VEQ8_9HYPH|nr:peptidoglycan-binding protein [Oricola thermophila]QKV19334.1 SEL1-like repeat protein [Oricola thermophila]
MLDDALSRLERRMGITPGEAGSREHRDDDISAIRARQEALARRAPAGDMKAEIERLREQLNREVSATIAQQFAAIREDLRELAANGDTMATADLADGLNRLTRELGLVASRVENSDSGALRAELEEIKGLVGSLAQEETLRDMVERWSVVEREIGSLPQSLGTREDLLAIAGRVSEIQDVLRTVPNAGAIDGVEEQIRTLAGAVEALAAQNVEPSPDYLQALDRRLDEISRAIATVSAAGTTVDIDTTPFERIEARLAALVNRVEESTASIRGDAVENRLAEIAERLGALHETVASSPETDAAIGDLARRMDEIARRLDEGLKPADAVPAELIENLNGRFEEIVGRLDTQSASAEEHGTRLLKSIEARMEELARRFEESESDPAPFPTFDHMERRIEEIAQMLSSGDMFSPDASALEGIEAQIAALSEKLSVAQPAVDTAALGDLIPRLAAVADQLAGGREEMIAAAREAAEEMLSRVTPGVSEDERGLLASLTGDLHELEEMARNSDSRNARGFEAIHDTLIKVADRIAGLEQALREDVQAGRSAPAVPQAAAHAVPHIENAPSVDFASGEDSRAAEADAAREPVAPKEAAILAARAAAEHDPELASGMDELAGFVAARRAASGNSEGPQAGPEAAPVPHVEPEAAPDMAADIADAPEPVPGNAPAGAEEDEEPAVFGKAQKPKADPVMVDDEPLEPGSGGPDLAAIMRRVREEREGGVAPKADPKASDEDIAKSDFIAAARRAARAAAAEASIQNASGRREDGKAKSKRRGGLLGASRRPLLLGASAIVLALLAFPLVRGYLSGAELPEEANGVADSAAVEAIPADMADDVRVVENEVQPIGEDAAETAAAEPETQDAAGIPDEAAMDVGRAVDMTPADGAEVAMAEPTAEEADTAAVEAGIDDTINTSAYPVLTLEDIPASVGPMALREAAVAGDAKALFVIGDRLMGNGSGSPDSDMTEAVRWYEMAAEQGFAPAQYRLGNAYEKGRGVERDLEAARVWYEQAAEQGNVNAMHNLAVLFATEIDGERDMKAAARWFIEAAERGVKDSQVNLGILSARGEGVPQDLVESYKWLALAARTGDKDAEAKRDEIARFLDPEQLEMAKGAVELWKPRQPDPQANEVDVPEAWTVSGETTASTTPAPLPAVDMTKAIRNIQAILNNAGFDAGTPDGIMGARTRQAIIEFQKANNLMPTGEIDRAFVDKLLEINGHPA